MRIALPVTVTTILKIYQKTEAKVAKEPSDGEES